jgi:hypothetical protein
LATTRAGCRRPRPTMAASRSRAAAAHQPLGVSRAGSESGRRQANRAACRRGGGGRRVENQAASGEGHRWGAGAGGRWLTGSIEGRDLLA